MARANKRPSELFDIEAEKRLIGALLTGADVNIDPSECYWIRHQRAIEAIRQSDDIADAARLMAKAMNDSDDGPSAAFLVECMNLTTDGYPANARIVRDLANRRRIVEQADELRRLAEDRNAEADDIKAALASIPDPVEGKHKRRVVFRSLCDVAPRPVEWLWPGRVPLGKLTLLAGDPGLGKSFLTIDVAARVSVGRPWKDSGGFAPPRGDVILLSAEDDPADTIRPRLDAAGGDPKRVHVIDGIHASAKRGERPRSFCLETDLSLLESMLDGFPETRLIVIDPISAYGNGSTDTHKNADVRAQLAALEKLAQDRQVAVLVVSHLNKSGVGKAVYRVSGSLAYTAAARIAWLLAQDRDDEKRRLLVQVKNNLAQDPGGLAFRVVDGRVDWEPDVIDIRADDLVVSDRREEQADGRNEAEEFLRHQLADGERLSSDVRAAAEADGISEKILRNAREKLCGTRREGFGKDTKTFWYLKDDTAAILSPTDALDAHSRPLCPVPETGHEGHEWGMSAENGASEFFDHF